MYKDPYTTAVRCDSRCDSNRHTITPDKLPVVLQLEFIWFRFKAWTGTIAAMLKYLDQASLHGQLISAEASLEDIYIDVRSIGWPVSWMAGKADYRTHTANKVTNRPDVYVQTGLH